MLPGAPPKRNEAREARQVSVNPCCYRRPVMAVPSTDLDRDALTGLPLGQAALARIDVWLDPAASSGPVFALLLGFARFDTVNMAFGLHAGDAALSETARRIETFAADELEDCDWFVARIDGGKFLLAAKGPLERERWRWLGEALADVVALPLEGEGVTVRLWPRLALAEAPDGEGSAALMARLAMASNRAARDPARRLTWIDSAPGHPILQGRTIEGDLLNAIDRDEIEVLFQPQLRAVDSALAGAEALARWRHPEHGELGAEALFDIAERADYLAPLTRKIAETALGHARRWPSSLRLSLNITPTDLASVDFDRAFLSVVERSGFATDRLTLEITEQVLLGDLEVAAASLRTLKRAGLSVALDDFGAGFCNFRYLQTLPLDTLKLDRAMVENLAEREADRAVLRAIVAMARALDLSVTAEGVETEAQRRIVTEEGCDSWQGYLESPPLRPEAFLERASA